jgi:response regulator of citrate/malate metabolism
MSAKNLLSPLLATLLVLSCFHGYSQTIQLGSIRNLYNSNGFKNLVLGSDIGPLANNLNYLDDNSRTDADSCIMYSCANDDMLDIDSTLKLDMVGIRTYKNKIVNIYLFFNQKDAYKVLQNFLQNYGQYTQKPIEYADVYCWNTDKVSLSLSYSADVDKGVAVFTFNPMLQNIQSDDKRRSIRLAAANLQASNMQ